MIHTTAASLCEDRPCPGCGYNLRGLSPAGQCPECGQALHGSLDERLCHADPQWLLRLRRGLGLALISGLLTGCLGVFSGIRVPSAGWGPLFEILRGALTLWAALLITSREPRLTLSESAFTLRRFIRVCAAGRFAADTLSGVRLVMATHPLMQLLTPLGTLLGVCTLVNELFYLRRLARRIPDPNLLFHLNGIIRGFIGVCGLGAALMITATLGGTPFGGGGSALNMLASLSSCALLSLVAVLGIWTLGMLWEFRSRLTHIVAGSVGTGPENTPNQ